MVIYFPRIYFALQKQEEISIESFPSNEWISEHSYRTSFTYSKRAFSKKKAKQYLIPGARFDPNTYSKKDWMNLGLSEKQSLVVLKFVERGIYSNDDLKKIFVIPNKLYELIKDSTIYPPKPNYDIQESKTWVEEPVKSLELNQASEEELVKLKGIGSFFAKQIIRKRNELGGFVKKEQLLEVWKMDEAKYEKIKDLVEINPTLIKKIALNSISIEELKVHPYIRWNIANSIIKMREQRNGFKSINDIKESVLINEELFEKLKPYLSL